MTTQTQSDVALKTNVIIKQTENFKDRIENLSYKKGEFLTRFDPLTES